MQIRVVKEGDGKFSLLVVSQAVPPVPAVAVQHLVAAEIGKRVSSVLAQVKLARMPTSPKAFV